MIGVNGIRTRVLLPVFLSLGLGACSTTPTASPDGDFPPPVPKAVEHQTGFTGDYVEFARTDIRPKATHMPPPYYPADFRRAGIRGSAVVVFIVEKDGTTSEIQVVKATDEAFALAAIEGVAQWRFSAGQEKGRVVRVAMSTPIDFRVSR